MKKMSKTIGIFMLGVIASFAINVAAEAVISSGAVSYSNTTVSAALDELFSAVDINNKIGTTDISDIGDGTITGSIDTVNSDLSTRAKMENLDLSIIESYNETYISNISFVRGYKIYNENTKGSHYEVILNVTIGTSLPANQTTQLFVLSGKQAVSYQNIGRMTPYGTGWVWFDLFNNMNRVAVNSIEIIPAGTYVVKLSYITTS